MVNNLKGVFGIVIFSIHDSIFTNLSTYWDLFVHTWGKDKKLCLVNLCRKGQTLTSPIHLPTHPPQWRCWVNNIHWWITGWPQEARIIFSEPRNEKKSHWENAPHFRSFQKNGALFITGQWEDTFHKSQCKFPVFLKAR